jgi:hypothetical protein
MGGCDSHPETIVAGRQRSDPGPRKERGQAGSGAVLDAPHVSPTNGIQLQASARAQRGRTLVSCNVQVRQVNTPGSTGHYREPRLTTRHKLNLAPAPRTPQPVCTAAAPDAFTTPTTRHDREPRPLRAHPRSELQARSPSIPLLRRIIPTLSARSRSPAVRRPCQARPATTSSPLAKTPAPGSARHHPAPRHRATTSSTGYLSTLQHQTLARFCAAPTASLNLECSIHNNPARAPARHGCLSHQALGAPLAPQQPLHTPRPRDSTLRPGQQASPGAAFTLACETSPRINPQARPSQLSRLNLHPAPKPPRHYPFGKLPADYAPQSPPASARPSTARKGDCRPLPRSLHREPKPGMLDPRQSVPTSTTQSPSSVRRSNNLYTRHDREARPTPSTRISRCAISSPRSHDLPTQPDHQPSRHYLFPKLGDLGATISSTHARPSQPALPRLLPLQKHQAPFPTNLSCSHFPKSLILQNSQNRLLTSA